MAVSGSWDPLLGWKLSWHRHQVSSETLLREAIAVRLHIQDPTDEQAPFLHEKILELCQGATHGAGAFGFVTREGVDLLLRDEVFRRFAKRGTFSLVVGIDGVTDLRALASLQEASGGLPGLTTRVFYHDLPQPVFHPKFCWFRHRRRGFLVTGSGNLTARGLRANWEAFAVDELDVKETKALEIQWTRWVALHGARLRPLDDAEVLARVAQNVRRPARGRRGLAARRRS